MKYVWILNHYAQEPGSPGGTRHYSLAKNLFAYGWAAYIIAGSVEINTGKQRLAAKEKFRMEKYDDVPFLWLRVPQYEGNGLSRITNMLAYSVQALLGRNLRYLPRPDVIIGSSVHPFAALSGLFLARRYRVPFIFEVRDLWPQTLIDMGKISPHGPSATFFGALEKYLYRHAKKIISLLPKADQYISSKGISANKVVWIPNGVDDFPLFFPPQNPIFTLMYFGAHGNANGLENVIKAFSFLQKLPIRLRLIGDGPLKPSLMELASTLNLTAVSFEPSVAKKQIPNLASQADAFIFNLVDIDTFRYGISSNKLFDFLAASRPVIFCCNSINNPVTQANAGITVLPEHPHLLAQAIETLFNMPLEEKKEMGKRGRQYVLENHHYQMLAKKLATLLDSV